MEIMVRRDEEPAAQANNHTAAGTTDRGSTPPSYSLYTRTVALPSERQLLALLVDLASQVHELEGRQDVLARELAHQREELGWVRPFVARLSVASEWHELRLDAPLRRRESAKSGLAD